MSFSRRELLAYAVGGAGLLAAGIAVGRSPQLLGNKSEIPPSATPDENSAKIVAALYPQQLLDQMTPSPTLPPASTPTAARPTLLSTPELTKQLATPTPEKVELQPKKLWEISIQSSTLGKFDNSILNVPAFTLAGKRLFVPNEQGNVVEIDQQTGRELWQWENRGTVLGSTPNTLLVLQNEVQRVYAIDPVTKDIKWKVALPEALLGSVSKNNLNGIKWPVYTTKTYTYIQLANGFVSIDQQGLMTSKPGVKIVAATSETIAFTNQPQSFRGLYKIDGITTNSNSAKEWHLEVLGHMVDDEFIYYQLPETKPPTPTPIPPGFPTPTPGPIIYFGYGTPFEWINLKTGENKNRQVQHPGSEITFVGGNYAVLLTNFPQYQTKSFDIFEKGHSNFYETILAKEKDSYNFFAYKEWLFASEARSGTISYLNGKKVWANDEILGAIKCVGEVNGNLILTRGGYGSGILTAMEVNGQVWAVDSKTGKIAWKPVLFDQFTTNSLRLGDKLVVVDGIYGARFALNTVDLKTGKKTVVDSKPSHGIIQLVDSGIDNIVMGEVIGGKLFAFRV